jgi:hypothetical protein
LGQQARDADEDEQHPGGEAHEARPQIHALCGRAGNLPPSKMRPLETLQTVFCFLEISSSYFLKI